MNRLSPVKVRTRGFRNLREAVGAVIGRPRVATEERASVLPKELTQVRAALTDVEGHSEERLALESRIQDLGFMQIQLRVRNARIAELEKEVRDLGGALAGRNEQVAEVKSEAAFLTQMRAALAESEARSEERRLALESRTQDAGLMQIQLRVRNARIAELEKEVRDSGGALARHNEQVGGAESDTAASLKDRIAALTATVAEQNASIAALKTMQLAEAKTLAAQRSDLARAIAESEVQRTNLGTLKAALAAANTRLAEKEAADLAALELRDSMQAAIAEQRLRVAQLEIELAGVVRDRDASVAAAAALQAEHLEQAARLAAASARVMELEAQAVDQMHVITAQQVEPSASLERVRDLESKLRAAEDSIHRLEKDLRIQSVRHEELAKTHEDSHDASVAHEVAAEGTAALLIRIGESEVVHVLGRKTTIGRTPENDLQIDAQYISRHHAVILAGRTQTIIEDLNSTNGVIVNGRRVQRETLKDGDIVLIGTAPFRFAMRPVAEPC